MFRIVICALCTSVFSFAGFAQSTRLEQVLDQVEQNNPELQAYLSYADSRRSQLKATNGLPGLELLGYYMPFGEHTTSDYYEFEVAQSFDFPSVYSARKELIGLQQDQLGIEYEQKRQAILLPAKKLCLELIYMNKRNEVVEQRVSQARQVMEQTQELFDREEVGILELNKAKVAWMQIRYSLDQVNAERAQVITRLEKLNGGQSIVLEDTDYVIELGLASLDSLWQQRMALDPSLRVLTQKENIASQQYMLAKRSNLPSITAGYNYQGFMGENYAGFMAGLSIPLWKGGARANSAKALSQYQQTYTSVEVIAARSVLSEQYQRYELLLSGLEEYRSTLAELGNDRFLKEAYELGQLSFINYYDESQFYWEAQDDMLLMEKELHQLKSELTKHQL
ncbi:MAG: TolC family protein [Cyclobacteriaceae bacterium]